MISYRQVPETSVRNYHYWLRNNPEELCSHTKACFDGLPIANTAVVHYPVCVVLWPWEITRCGPWPRGQNTAAAQPCVYESKACALRNSNRTWQDKVGAEQGHSPVRAYELALCDTYTGNYNWWGVIPLGLNLPAEVRQIILDMPLEAVV